MRRLPGWLRRLWPRRLAGQMIALLLLALVLAQAASYLIFADARWAALQTAERGHILARTASIVRLIENTPASLHDQILRTASSRQLRFWLSDRSAVAASDADGDSWLRRRLMSLLDDGLAREVLIDPGKNDQHFWSQDDDARRDERIAAVGEIARAGEVAPEGAARWRAHWHHRLPPADLMISTRLADGRWLNAGFAVPDPPPRWPPASLAAMAVTAAALSLIVTLMVRRITRPMAELAAAAERLGRGEAVPAIAEHGSLDVRQTMRAFNRMRGRLQRFVQDRTRMLAAISHDLRTPITTLRLRAEFVEDEETRARILETLDEMQRMTEATLAFAREEATVEDTRTVDLAALVESVCADLADLGQDVSFKRPRAPGLCLPPDRPQAGGAQPDRERGRLWQARPGQPRGRRGGAADRDRRRRPRHPRGGHRARVRALRPARGVALARDRRHRPRHGDRALDRARPRRRHRARQPGGRRPARRHPPAEGGARLSRRGG